MRNKNWCWLTVEGTKKRESNLWTKFLAKAKTSWTSSLTWGHHYQNCFSSCSIWDLVQHYITAEQHKMRSQLTAQFMPFFRLIARILTFCDKKYRILTFRDKKYRISYFIFVTTITTAGCVKKSVKCKIFQWIRERNCFDIAQNV